MLACELFRHPFYYPQRNADVKSVLTPSSVASTNGSGPLRQRWELLNQVLWTLDNETDSKTFERLCIDLLYRNGYTNIVPVGGIHDRGRDAEAYNATGTGAAGELTFFQFSLQETWKQKLQSELKKVAAEGHEISKYVFISSRDISGRDRDQFRDAVASKYGWELLILPREWLRLQLEEAHPDIAHRHLGITFTRAEHSYPGPFRIAKPTAGDPQRAWDAFVQGDYERASAELRAYLQEHPTVVDAWEALAWSLYEQLRFYEALVAINKALELEPSSNQTKSIRACILAEYGISRGDRRSISEANRLFQEILHEGDNWIVRYNLGNTLSALSRHKEAIEQYIRATELESRDPRIWKNLASSYHEIGEHELEMQCFDRALALDPDHAIALMSKGVSVLTDFDNASEAIQLMERAFTVEPNLIVQWPNAWYWLGEAYRREGRYREALAWVENGLRHVPGAESLRRLKFSLYSSWWRTAPEMLLDAQSYFLQLLTEAPLDYSARMEVAQTYEAQEREDEAWETLQGAFAALDEVVMTPLRGMGFTLSECYIALEYLPTYLAFRRSYPVSDYWDVSDPLYDLEEAPSPNKRFEDELFVACAIPFGLGYDVLACVDPEQRTADLIGSAFDVMRDRLRIAIPQAAKTFVEWIPPKTEIETLSKRFSLLLLFVPLVGVREFGRQRGWLSGSLSLSREVMNEVLDTTDEAGFMGELLERTLLEVNSVAHVFPESEEENS